LVLLNDLQTQGNAGPHSFVGLLSSFQRPSDSPRTERTRFESRPTAASRGLRAGFRKGRRIYISRPASSRGGSEETSANLSTRGTRFLHRVAPSRQAYSRPLSRRFRHRGALLLPLVGLPVKRQVRRVLRNLFAPRGAASTLSSGPRQASDSERSARNLLLAKGAASTPRRGPRQASDSQLSSSSLRLAERSIRSVRLESSAPEGRAM
jgi:hypothetical protein